MLRRVKTKTRSFLLWKADETKESIVMAEDFCLRCKILEQIVKNCDGSSSGSMLVRQAVCKEHDHFFLYQSSISLPPPKITEIGGIGSKFYKIKWLLPYVVRTTFWLSRSTGKKLVNLSYMQIVF